MTQVGRTITIIKCVEMEVLLVTDVEAYSATLEQPAEYMELSLSGDEILQCYYEESEDIRHRVDALCYKRSKDDAKAAIEDDHGLWDMVDDFAMTMYRRGEFDE
tara:strand:+ start:1281 stop:1592 length:312 start_codon:yes stop_codon:yes gene_type:complete